MCFNYYLFSLVLRTCPFSIPQVLLEKLLHECPDVRLVYVLIREKKGISVNQRLDELLDSPVFSGTKRTPKSLCQQKISPVYGDAAKERLGTSDFDWSTLVNEVNVIINSAASVRFDDPMVKALGINCMSAISCLQLCREAKQCVSFVHVSTCYSNCQFETIDEKFYPTKITYEELMVKPNNMSSDELDELCRNEYFDGRPNSYAFSKALAEDYLRRHGDGLPLAVTRLSIVTPSLAEPEPGFVDVTQGGVFIMFCQGLGAVRTFRYNPNQLLQTISVDTSANAILAVAYLTTTKAEYHSRIYNVTKPVMTIEQLLTMTINVVQTYPSIRAFRAPTDLRHRQSQSTILHHYNRWVNEWLIVVLIQFVLKPFGIKQ